MHTTEEVDAADFSYHAADGVSRDEVLPPITPETRLGVVMDSGTDGIGAGNFILSSVTAFYDHRRQMNEDVFEYPDYYTFQTTSDPADYRMLDIYPDYKNVTVEPDAEQLLRAINDRAITILLVPDRPMLSPEIDDISLRSAERRITHCYLYATDGQVIGADFTIQLPRQLAEEWYESTARSVEAVPETYTLPSVGSNDEQIVQQFRQITLGQALARLPR